MTEERFQVRLVSQSWGDLDGCFHFDDEFGGHDTCRLTLCFDEREITATDWTYFHALCRIREELEVLGLRPFCYGSSRNVYPSGMSCDMGGGLVAYRMKIGQPAKTTDLVGIFASGPDVEPVTVSDQEKYRDDWYQSLAKPIEPTPLLDKIAFWLAVTAFLPIAIWFGVRVYFAMIADEESDRKFALDPTVLQTIPVIAVMWIISLVMLGNDLLKSRRVSLHGLWAWIILVFPVTPFLIVIGRTYWKFFTTP